MKWVLSLSAVALLSACVVLDDGRPRGKAAQSVTLCHKGNKTMELPQEAARAHLDHGDTYGPCGSR